MKGLWGFVVDGQYREVVFACVLDDMLLILLVDTCDVRFLEMRFSGGNNCKLEFEGSLGLAQKTQKVRLF